MSFDPRRYMEATCQSALVLGAVVPPAVWAALDGPLVAVLGAMLALLTSGFYALHAVTFDCFRLTGQRARRGFSYTRSKE